MTFRKELETLASRRRFLAAGGGLLVLSGCTTFDALTPSQGATSDQTDAVLPMINVLRAEHGLPALSRGKNAVRAAEDQADRMARHGEMEHNIGFGANFADRMQGMNVALPAAENIAEGQGSAARAFNAWVHSPKHLKNMLGSYTGLGVAVSQNSASANRPYWSMVLSN